MSFTKSDTPAISPNQQRGALLVLLLLAFALRLYRLGAESLWYDETVSVALARKNVSDLLAHTAGDIHPPGYYLLLHGWQQVTQPSLQHGLEFLFAWPSLWFGLLIVALLYPLARTSAGTTPALLTVGLAAIHPFHLWYSQEVRMYTLGAALGLLCLWATRQFLQQTGKAPRRWLFVYLLVAAAGLYTLYYFLFLLLPLNLAVLWLLWSDKLANSRNQLSLISYPSTARRAKPMVDWLLAQVGVLLLWAPWLPIFWRQAVDPPVPPWRLPWQQVGEMGRDLAETLGTLLVGQSPPGGINWPWAWLTLALFGLSIRYVNAGQLNVTAWRLILACTFGPIVLIYLLTGTVTPLYHVRYLFTYAPPFTLLVALALLALYRRQRVLGLLAMVGLLVVNGWSLQQFWFSPQHRADDHRAAVAELAAAWRPGDLILVNAGWAYPPLLVYWPTELANFASALPPAISRVERLTTYVDETAGAGNNSDPLVRSPVLVRTGSVDGSPRLGWGDPRSDFFALSSADTDKLLGQLRTHFQRIWHYRLYDTVSDPQGKIRTWLEANNTLLADWAIPGRDFLRVQLYQPKQLDGVGAPRQHKLPTPIPFGGAVILTGAYHPPEMAAGTTLYVATDWHVLAAHPSLPDPLAFSLRLYDQQGQLVAQQDAHPLPSTRAWLATSPQAMTLALPLSAATKPGGYALALVVYAASTGQPLAAQLAGGEQPLVTLGEVAVTVSQQTPQPAAVVATFDYLDLLAAQAQLVDQTLAVDLIWQPRPSAYTDTYLAQIELHNAQGTIVAQWQAALGGWDYPSGGWPATIPVRDQQRFLLEAPLPPGHYTVMLRLLRNRDQSVIPARQGWWPSQPEAVPVTMLEVGP